MLATDMSQVRDQLNQIKYECENEVALFTAGNLKNCIGFWQNICDDPSVLEIINGLTIPLNQTVYQGKIPKEISFSSSEQEKIESEIHTMVKQKVIEPVSNQPVDGEFISNIFMRPKKDGGVRVILNLKEFNEFVEKKHFKMKSLQTAIDLMSKDAYLASVDFKSAYFSVSVKKSDRKYLRLFFKGKKYQFGCLPNGLTTGPRDFTKVVKSLFKYLREKGYLNTFYLDDSFLVDQDFLGCFRNVVDTIQTSRKAGFCVHPVKSVLIPTKTLVYLGFLLSTIDMTVRLTKEKVQSITHIVENVLAKSLLTIQELAELVGKLVATFPAVPLGKLYYRQLDIEKGLALKRAKGNYSEKLELSKQAKSDLSWWLENLPNSFTKIESKNPDIEIRTDASTYSYGGCFHDKSISGQWHKEEQTLHINLKEMLAVYYTLTKLCH